MYSSDLESGVVAFLDWKKAGRPDAFVKKSTKMSPIIFLAKLTNYFFVQK
jgi:hypothetical protein